MSPNRRSIATHHKTVSVFACAFKKQGSTCAFVPDIGAIARNFLGSCLFTMSTTSTTLLTRPPTVYHIIPGLTHLLVLRSPAVWPLPVILLCRTTIELRLDKDHCLRDQNSYKLKYNWRTS